MNPFTIPLSYTWRSLWTRKTTTILTLGGIALVVFVWASTLMMSYGIEETLVDSGSPENVIILRRAATSELVSQVDRDAANIIRTHPEVAQNQSGSPIASAEMFTVINLSKRETGDMGNVSVRGVQKEAFDLRPFVTIIAGRAFSFGTDEIMVGTNLAEKFDGCEIGSRIKFGDSYWTIVGHFAAEKSSFESEIWGDVEQLMPSFGRPVFSSLTFRLISPDKFDAVKERIEQDPRTQYAQVKTEQGYYREQSQLMSTFIWVLGLIVTIIFSFGAIIGAMITMYASVANRTTEIGTLRALGFLRRSILSAFFVESMLLSLVGGIVGIVLASGMSFVRVSTVNWGTFSELGFGFELSMEIVLYSLLFSVIMGIVGGFLPAIRASRLEITSSLRAS